MVFGICVEVKTRKTAIYVLRCIARDIKDGTEKIHTTFPNLMVKARTANVGKGNVSFLCDVPSIRNRLLCSGMLLYLHHRNSKIFFHPANFDNFKDEKISEFKTVSVSQSKNLLDRKLVV